MKHRTIILITHAVDLCLPGASFIVSMENGTVVYSGSPDELSLLNSGTGSTSTSTLQGTLTGTDLRSKLGQSSTLVNGSDPSASSFTIEEIAAQNDIGTGSSTVEGGEDELPHIIEAKRAKAEKLKLVQDETKSEGAVSAKVYL